MLFCHISKIKSLRLEKHQEWKKSAHINTTPDITSIQTRKKTKRSRQKAMVYPTQIKDFNQALRRSNILFHNPRGSIPDHFLVLQRSPVIDVASFRHIFLPQCLGPSFQEKWEGWEISQQSEWKNCMKHDVFAKEISLVMLKEKKWLGEMFLLNWEKEKKHLVDN